MALGYTSSADNNGSLVSSLNVIFLAGTAYVDSGQLYSNLSLFNVPTAYTASIDNIAFTSIGGDYVTFPSYTASIDVVNFALNPGGSYVTDPSYTSSVDAVNFELNFGGNYVTTPSYTSSVDDINFVSFGGIHLPWVYTDQMFLNTLVGTKNPTYGYVDTSNLLSSNLTGVKNTQALTVAVTFNSSIPYVRLNIPSNAPFLKQVFVE